MNLTREQYESILNRPAIRRANWSAEELLTLSLYYRDTPPERFSLSDIATSLGKSVSAVACKASELGICAQSRPKSDQAKDNMSKAQTSRSESPIERKKRSEDQKLWLSQNPHPRGFAGKKRTNEEKQKISDAAKSMWGDPGHIVNSEEHRQKLSDRFTKISSGRTATNSFSRTKKGFREDIGIFCRSPWEANYARYLNLLKANGEIKSWQYEPKTFWFEKIKRGCRSWKPDFLVITNNESEEYHEVKGWMYPRAKTALKRMRIYHPSIQVVLIDQTRYRAISKTMGSVIQNWEK